MSDLIADNYEAYTNFGIYPDVANLSESERDQLDEEVAQQLNQLKSKLDVLHLGSSKHGPPVEGSYALFKQTVIAAVVESFQQVNKLSGQLQIVRMRRTLAGRPALCAVGSGVMKENKFDVKVAVDVGAEEEEGEGEGGISDEMRDAFELENAELQVGNG